MRKKLYMAIGCLLMMQPLMSSAQCAGGRYYNQIFDYTKSTVTYSDTFGLQMDIYEPAGDVVAARPLIILAHGGSFIGGSKTDDSTVVKMCRNFARRGYVTASIDYRVSLVAMFSPDSSQQINEVMQAVSDGKAAIRYFMKDASSATPAYRIDTNNIFIGGNSAGAVLYMHVGYLDSFGECPSYIQTAMTANGGFEGNSGNPGYTTPSRAVIDLAGGLNMVEFIGPGNKPSVNIQGDVDNVVPYTCAYPNIGVTVHVTLCGLGSMEPQFVAQSINHMSKVFPGAGHVPWNSDAAMFTTVDSLVTVFLYGFTCPGSVAGVDQTATSSDVSLYPNPATDALNIRSSMPVSEVVVYDQTGRTTSHMTGINSMSAEINTSRLAKGLYFVKMKFSDDNIAPVVRRIVVE